MVERLLALLSCNNNDKAYYTIHSEILILPSSLGVGHFAPRTKWCTAGFLT